MPVDSLIGMIPVEAWPWIIIAFLIGFNGREAVRYIAELLREGRDVKDAADDLDRDRDRDGDSPDGDETDGDSRGSTETDGGTKTLHDMIEERDASHGRENGMEKE